MRSANPQRSPLAVAAANTQYVVCGRAADEVTTARELAAWYEAWIPHSVIGPEPGEARAVGDADAAAFHRLRDALRPLLVAAVEGTPPDPDAVAVLNGVAERAPLWPSLTVRDWGLEIIEQTRARYADAALGVIARDGMQLLSGPLAADLRMCGAPRCIQFFLSSDPRRLWCSPGCGNRARVARHYDRHRRTPMSG
jgi:predicted RNA-binding Zn ribbon-like protein